MEGIYDRCNPKSHFDYNLCSIQVLEERHYPSFLVVLTCQMTGRQSSNGCETDSSGDSRKGRRFSWKMEPWIADESDDQGVIEWSEQTQLVKSRLEQVDARLVVKLQVKHFELLFSRRFIIKMCFGLHRL